MKKSLAERQAQMKLKNDQQVKLGRPTAADTEDDLGLVRLHLVAWKLLQLGHSTHTVVQVIRELFDQDLTREAVELWVEQGTQLRFLQLRD